MDNVNGLPLRREFFEITRPHSATAQSILGFFTAKETKGNATRADNSQQQKDPRWAHEPEPSLGYAISPSNSYIGKEQAREFGIALKSLVGPPVAAN